MESAAGGGGIACRSALGALVYICLIVCKCYHISEKPCYLCIVSVFYIVSIDTNNKYYVSMALKCGVIWFYMCMSLGCVKARDYKPTTKTHITPSYYPISL